MEITDSLRFLKQVKKIRQELKYNRENFWSKNKGNFRNNLKTLASFFPAPEGWTLSIIASTFLLDRGEIMPYDKDVWSFVDVVSGTEAQGHEIIVFFNKTDLEFLSAPALLPIVIHEMRHVYQIPQDTKNSILSTIDDELNRELEKDADAEVRNFNDEFRKENVLEKVLFCFDKKGWSGAKKMVDYLYKESKDAFGGGYDQEMTKAEYEAFSEASEEKDIDIFIDFFIKTDHSEKDSETKEKLD